MQRKDIYLGDPERKAVDVIVERGHAESTSGAVRLALREYARTLLAGLPMVTPSTPAL